MSVPILATKLYILPLPPKVVTRPRLIKQLTEGLFIGRKLTLISAPAGFGKSTLVSEWIASCERPVAWLSLDENDNDPARFLVYFIAALQTIWPNLGAEILNMLQAPQLFPIDSVLTALLNEIATIPNDFILVLDDYHLVDTKSIDEALTFLIDHLPPQMHLVITTREDPSLPIPRLRARNQLTELRAADLRFITSEAAEFFDQVMGLNPSTEDIATLESRTEGWIAGLQLAALSLKGQEDVHGFIQAFAGDHRYIVDYLIEEVLQRQPEPIRNFLLQTSILERLNGSLCDAVIGNHPEGTFQQGGKSKLEQLQRGNLFLIPLDDKRDWYRYHHLFADVLRMHLITEQPDQVHVLHRRASEWYEQNGSANDAIRHALAAKDFERAADLMERGIPIMRSSRQESTLLGWLQALPEKLIRHRPVLCAAHAWTLLAGGKLENVEARLRDTEQWLDTTANRSEMVVVNQEEFAQLPGVISVYRAVLSQARGDVPDTVNYARQALDLFAEENHLGRGAAATLLGLASWASGDLDAAQSSYEDGIASLQRAGHISDVIGNALSLADIWIAQGCLREAMRIYEQGLQFATAQSGLTLRGAADMYVGMSELYRERNDLDIAEQYLLKSSELGEFAGLPQNSYRWRVAMARIREVQGDVDATLDLLHDAERRYVSDFSPNVHPIAALRTRILIRQGRLSEALGWVQEQKLSSEEPLGYLREFEHITLARLLLARYKADHAGHFLLEAMGLLERLLKAAEDGGRQGSVIEILILQALAHQIQENIPAALASLERALTLAEPEGYVRIFLDEGPGMATLLREAATRQIMPNYSGRLLESLKQEPPKGRDDTPHPVLQPLVESLSQRELEILRLFKTELSGPEIAQELVIALSTVRTHTKSLYSKLNVNSRRAAVKRAIELGLI
ncbi:MAG: helix-turn-helix transcriptional regulator [Chloroflexi bacterium]|nr:helix-turn-helix transcriptional regulator [Chloroflexota bacterium]